MQKAKHWRGLIFGLALLMTTGCGPNETAEAPVERAPPLPGQNQKQAAAFSTIMACGDYTVALKQDGSLWAWGRPGTGFFKPELPSATPVQVMADVASFAGTDNNFFVIKNDGVLYGAGHIDFEDDLQRERNVFVEVLRDVKSVNKNGRYAVKQDEAYGPGVHLEFLMPMPTRRNKTKICQP